MHTRVEILLLTIKYQITFERTLYKTIIPVIPEDPRPPK